MDGVSWVRPASILDISSTSLINASRCSPLRLIVPRYCAWRAVTAASRSISCENPRMAFIGVRISCDMFARNVLLARFACFSDCSYRFRSVTSRAAANTPRSLRLRSWNVTALYDTTVSGPSRCRAVSS